MIVQLIPVEDLATPLDRARSMLLHMSRECGMVSSEVRVTYKARVVEIFVLQVPCKFS